MKLKHEIEVMNIDPPQLPDTTETLYFLLTLLQAVKATTYDSVNDINHYVPLLNGTEEIIAKNKLFEIIGRL